MHNMRLGGAGEATGGAIGGDEEDTAITHQDVDAVTQRTCCGCRAACRERGKAAVSGHCACEWRMRGRLRCGCSKNNGSTLTDALVGYWDCRACPCTLWRIRTVVSPASATSGP